MSFRESTLQWVEKMLLCDMIRLRDVPKEIRTAAGGVYITALRISNSVSAKRFVQDLIVLAQDIYTMPEYNPRLYSQSSGKVRKGKGQRAVIFQR